MSPSSRDFNMNTTASQSSAISVDDYLQRCFQAIDDLANNPYVNGTLPGPDEGSAGQDHRGSIQESPMRGSSQRSQNQVSGQDSSQYLDTSRSQTPKVPTGSRSTTPIPRPPKYASDSSSKSMKSPVDHMHLPPVAPKPESKIKGFRAFMRPSWR
ncbi:hypothetical protein AC579_3545 [Pseudocercospora musae]|uniref:Uncharacterized protein n=1 Tax=Pseudocercospora musae TaxID=113226 RepID=A0A139IVX7_9PEZI|nr:hypothetical protein AC579_3545 [Pseudocercospora musae]